MNHTLISNVCSERDETRYEGSDQIRGKRPDMREETRYEGRDQI